MYAIVARHTALVRGSPTPTSSLVRARLGSLQCYYRRGVARADRPREFLFRAVFVILHEPPHQVGSFFGIQAEQSEFNEFVRSDLAGPSSAYDLAFIVFLEVDFKA